MSFEDISYEPLAEVLDNIFLIQTSLPWLWGDYKYGYFLISIEENLLKLIDYHIPDSVFPTKITKYKIEEDYLKIIADNEEIILFINGP